MKLSPTWLRDFVDVKVDDRRLAEDLTSAGIAVEGISGEGDAIAFEMEITPNRPDAMNHYGVARECSAIYDVELKPLRPNLPSATGHANFPIEIEDAVGCGRYTGQILRDVKIQPSPRRIAQRLEWVEQRPINNAADATNYTLWEIGHPTHVFDLDLLEGKIVVRRARTGETLKTLDGVDRKLSPDDLVIADARRPVALAGVMGGFDTMITERTRNILIEAAWFDPASVRRTARVQGMHTDASHRFERGADWAATSLACARVAQLILDSAGGRLEGGQIDTIARRLEQPSLALHRSEVRRILGQDIPEQEIERILRRLGFAVNPGRASVAASTPAAPRTSGGAHAAVAEEVEQFTVGVPSWRLDIEREIDLVEEIARLHGFDNFPNTLPAFSGAVVELPQERKEAKVRSTLLSLGYNEAVSLSFISHEDAKRFSSAQAIEIANPLSEEASVMRTSLVPGMLNMLGWNLNRGSNDVHLFECGNVFELSGSRADERRVACLGATGNAVLANVDQPFGRSCSFFDLKGDVETALSAFDCKSLYFDAQSADYYHPGRSARAVMDGATVARFGQLHPEIAAARKLRQDVFIAELLLDRLYQHALHRPAYKPLPRYPAVERDFSFIFDDTVTWEKIRAAVDALHIPELRSFEPAEVFRGGSIAAGKYSLLSRARFQSDERTLREDEVAQWSTQIIQALQALGGTLRAS